MNSENIKYSGGRSSTKNITKELKKEIIKYHVENKLMSQRSLAKKFNVSIGSINKILKEKVRESENLIVKQGRKLVKSSKIDEKLIKWLENKRNR